MINSVVIVGRVGQDPEMKYFEKGSVKTTFSVAVNRFQKDIEKPDWFRIELWGRQAEVAGEYVRKGSLVGIEGRLEFNHWTDNEGNKHLTHYIAGDRLQLLGKKMTNAE